VAPLESHWHGAQTGKRLKHLAVTRGKTDWAEEVILPSPPEFGSS
jgi:hypothetical protein